MENSITNFRVLLHTERERRVYEVHPSYTSTKDLVENRWRGLIHVKEKEIIVKILIKFFTQKSL